MSYIVCQWQRYNNEGINWDFVYLKIYFNLILVLEGVQIFLYTVSPPPYNFLYIEKTTRMYYVYKEIILHYCNSSWEASKHPNAVRVFTEIWSVQTETLDPENLVCHDRVLIYRLRVM